MKKDFKKRSKSIDKQISGLILDIDKSQMQISNLSGKPFSLFEKRQIFLSNIHGYIIKNNKFIISDLKYTMPFEANPNSTNVRKDGLASSLVSNINNNEDFKEWFKKFPLPAELKPTKNVTKIPNHKHYSVVGTSLDNIISLKLEKSLIEANNDRVYYYEGLNYGLHKIYSILKDIEIALRGGPFRSSYFQLYSPYNISDFNISENDTVKLQKITVLLLTILQSYYKGQYCFYKTGEFTDSFIESILNVSKFNLYYRTSTPSILNDVKNNNPETIIDLSDFSNNDYAKLLPSKYIIISPEFGSFIDTLNAHGDFIIDDTIIDVKTTIKGFKREYLSQLLSYYFLNKLPYGRFIHTHKYNNIKKVGIYYSRVDEIRILDLDEYFERCGFKESKLIDEFSNLIFEKI